MCQNLHLTYLTQTHNTLTVTVDDSILESHPRRSKSKARPHQYKKSCSDSNLLSLQRPQTPVSPTTTATTISSRSSASKSIHLQKGSSKGINAKRYHPPPPPRQRSPNPQTRHVAAAHAASAPSSSSSSVSVKDATAAQLRELCIDIIQTRPRRSEKGNQYLVTQFHRQRAKDVGMRKTSIDEIPCHTDEIPHSPRSSSRFAEIKDEWPASRRIRKDTSTAQLKEPCIDIIQTRPKRGNRDLTTQSHRKSKKDVGVRKKGINEIPPRSRSRFAEIKDEWPEGMRLNSDIEIVLESCDDLISCVSLPSAIQRHLD